jgi:hypothetical protein
VTSVRYYKLVRPDGTNCGVDPAHRVVYEVGKVTRPVGPVAVSGDVNPINCSGPGRLHVWPRPEHAFAYLALGVPVLDHRILAGVVPPGERVLGRDGEKVAVSAFLATEELPIAAGFGPNGVAVVEFLRELPSYPWLSRETGDAASAQQLVDASLAALDLPPVPVRFGSWAAAWGATWHAAWDATRSATWDATWDATRSAAWGAARSAAWNAARSAAWDAAWGAATDDARHAAWDAARSATWDAARRAAARSAQEHSSWLVVADLLPGRGSPFAPLMALWRLGYYVGGVRRGKFVLGVLKP